MCLHFCLNCLLFLLVARSAAGQPQPRAQRAPQPHPCAPPSLPVPALLSAGARGLFIRLHVCGGQPPPSPPPVACAGDFVLVVDVCGSATDWEFGYMVQYLVDRVSREDLSASRMLWAPSPSSSPLSQTAVQAQSSESFSSPWDASNGFAAR